MVKKALSHMKQNGENVNKYTEKAHHYLILNVHMNLIIAVVTYSENVHLFKMKN